MAAYKVPVFHVDAFSSKPFGGNPAAVCLLSSPLADETRQKIAAELNLSETAFVEVEGTGNQESFSSNDTFNLRCACFSQYRFEISIALVTAH